MKPFTKHTSIITSITLILFIQIFFISRAFAETVTLDSGKTLSGTIIKADTREFTIQTDKGDFAVPYKMLKNVEITEENKRTNPELTAAVLKIFNEHQGKRQKKNEEVAKKINGKQTELYMTSWCPYCRKIAKFFTEKEVNYIAYDIERDKEAKQRFKYYGGKGVPLVKVNNKIIKGYDIDAIWSALIE